MLSYIKDIQDYTLFALSTDEKPTEGVSNGTKLIEMDTSSVFYFDAENQVWLKWGGTSV